MLAVNKDHSYSYLSNLINHDKPEPVFRNVAIGQLPDRLRLQVSSNLKTLKNPVRAASYRDQVLDKFDSDYFRKDLMNFDDAEIVSLSSAKAHSNAKLQLTVKDWKALYQTYQLGLFHIGASMPHVNNNATENHYRSACKRLTNQLWWRRTLRTAQLRLIESEHIKIGHVSRITGQLYCSNEVLAKRQFHKRRNERLLESIVAVNQEGYEQDLKSLADVSTSNPKIRRSELMARLRGLEEYANSIKFVADFYTFTCPSSFHRFSTASSQSRDPLSFLNGRYCHSTPRDSQAYLNKQWSKIRAELHRLNIDIFGMRVAEPHHDGTPHWHLLLFFNRKNRKTIRRVFRHYALEVNPDEKGAQKHRFTAIKIGKKTKRGKPSSAVGYICKYISKNLSTDGLDTDETINDGRAVSETVSRVEAWASVWGIRQFQQIGGERITPYRELRRLRAMPLDAEHKPFHSVWQSADSGNYADYIRQCNANQKIIIIRQFEHLNAKRLGSRHVVYSRINESTGEFLGSDFTLDRTTNTKFGELKVPLIIGIQIGTFSLITRINSWTIKARRLSRASAAGLRALDLCH